MGKGYDTEIVILGRDSMGNEENRMLRKVDDFGKTYTLMLPENQAGKEAGTFPLIDKEIFLDFSSIKEMLLYIYIKNKKNNKNEVDRCLSKSSWA